MPTSLVTLIKTHKVRKPDYHHLMTRMKEPERDPDVQDLLKKGWQVLHIETNKAQEAFTGYVKMRGGGLPWRGYRRQTPLHVR